MAWKGPKEEWGISKAFVPPVDRVKIRKKKKKNANYSKPLITIFKGP